MLQRELLNREMVWAYYITGLLKDVAIDIIGIS